MDKLPNSMSAQELMGLINSPSGQKLIKLLQSKDPESLKQIAEKAKSGDFQQAKSGLSSLLDSDEIKEFLKGIGG